MEPKITWHSETGINGPDDTAVYRYFTIDGDPDEEEFSSIGRLYWELKTMAKEEADLRAMMSPAADPETQAAVNLLLHLVRTRVKLYYDVLRYVLEHGWPTPPATEDTLPGQAGLPGAAGHDPEGATEGFTG